jgi:hypothetical protein
MRSLITRSAVALVAAASIGLVAPSVAFAAGGSPAPTTTSTTTTTVATVKSHPRTLAAYRADRTAINQAFKWAVESAQTIFQQAKAQATTAAARSTARAAYELSLIQAAATRDNALTALGKPPTR